MPTDLTTLNRVGLNLQAVFNIEDLPAELAAEIRSRFDSERQYRQLILIGHGGKTLWTSLQAAGMPPSENPIDDFSVACVERWFAEKQAGHPYRIAYPGETPIGLQTLGKLAGWHHPSPFMVGINPTWGSWYAYRVVVLADTDLPTSPGEASVSPCTTCQEKPCVSNCPGKALADGTFKLQKCIAYRKLPASLCKKTCLARISCPVGQDHRYCTEQIEHTYSISLRMIERYY